MIIKTVKLTNFRIHKQYRLDCRRKTSVIVGENGCGKTSVLEAIYIALRGKSFRAVDREILRRGAEFYRVEVEYENGKIVVVVFDKVKKQFLVEDKKFGRLSKTEQYPVILFLPEDLHLVSTSPTKRREYFDRSFRQLDFNYNDSLVKYMKILKQRNELLKTGEVRSGDIFSWNMLLAKYGCELNRKRKELIGVINARVTEKYRVIADNQDEVKILYKSEVNGVDESGYLQKLEINLDRDKYVGYTNFGIHKDGYDFIFNEVVADGSASRGEVRSMILALKFIEAELIWDRIGKKPLVLLDDVFSELDEVRQKCLVKNFKDNQIIITSVEIADFEAIKDRN